MQDHQKILHFIFHISYDSENYWLVLDPANALDGDPNYYDVWEAKIISKQGFITDPAYRAEYILSSGTRCTENAGYVNPRLWNMYKDTTLDQQGYIKDVHIMTYDEASQLTEENRKTGGVYWLSNAKSCGWLSIILNNGVEPGYGDYIGNNCFGIRPIVTLNDGVYIASGTGTQEDPYILGK